jgi:hypothetical protein
MTYQTYADHHVTPRTDPVCGACNGYGMIGGLLPNGGGYDGEPCPECCEARRDRGQEITLWAVHIPGPDDMAAAPSKEAAEYVAKHHNETVVPALQKFRDSRPEAEHAYFPPIESCMAYASPWPWDADEHAESVAEDWPEFLADQGLTVDGVEYATRETATEDMFARYPAGDVESDGGEHD